MKTCPCCSFSNEERFPTCVWCNVSLVDVSSRPSSDPAAPEHEWRATNERRRQLCRSQLRFAGICYALCIVVTAFAVGLVVSPWVLSLYLLGSLIVVGAVVRDIVGQLSVAVLQASCTAALLVLYGPWHILIFSMLILHIFLAAFFWHWIEMIYGTTR